MKNLVSGYALSDKWQIANPQLWPDSVLNTAYIGWFRCKL